VLVLIIQENGGNEAKHPSFIEMVPWIIHLYRERCWPHGDVISQRVAPLLARETAWNATIRRDALIPRFLIREITCHSALRSRFRRNGGSSRRAVAGTSIPGGDYGVDRATAPPWITRNGTISTTSSTARLSIEFRRDAFRLWAKRLCPGVVPPLLSQGDDRQVPMPRLVISFPRETLAPWLRYKQ